MPTTIIADLGTGNLRSVYNAVRRVRGGGRVAVSAQPADIARATHLILPGQGALGSWMKQLADDAKLRDAVRGRLKDGPVLGICLGLQALYDYSEENCGTDGLAIFKGAVRKFSPATAKLKIPHMGWNQVRHTRVHPLWEGIADQQHFYFVHSYYVENTGGDEVVGECAYGSVFTAAAARANLFATQFHPEKSQHAGLRLLENFVRWDGSWDSTAAASS